MKKANEKHLSASHRFRLPGFLIEEEIGLGCAIKRVTYAVGIKPCGCCENLLLRSTVLSKVCSRLVPALWALWTLRLYRYLILRSTNSVTDKSVGRSLLVFPSLAIWNRGGNLAHRLF